MHLPQELLQAIEKRVEGVSMSRLSLASSGLTDRYRKGREKEKYVHDDADRLAYILARMPATFAVICRVFKEILQRQKDFSPTSFLDIGSGPGTGLWAARESFSSTQSFYAWEYDAGFIDLSKDLCSFSSALKGTQFFKRNIEVDADLPTVDLALISYAIGEVEEKYWPEFLQALWSNTNQILVVIEPGTPAGYSRILKVRQMMLSLGAHLIAPCPHAQPCPLKEPDWCHFYARVERSSLHRMIKGASLGFEDEKFSYLIFSKDNYIKTCEERILRFPQIHKGHVNLSLCTKNEGILNKTVTKKDKEKYKIIKKMSWGDSI